MKNLYQVCKMKNLSVVLVLNSAPLRGADAQRAGAPIVRVRTKSYVYVSKRELVPRDADGADGRLAGEGFRTF